MSGPNGGYSTQLDGGTGTADKIGINDAALTSAEYAIINAAKNFEVLGLNAGITVDASSLTSIKSFSLDGDAAQTVTNMATGSSVSLPVAHANNVSLSGAVGVNDVAVTVGSSTTTGFTVGGNLTLGQTQVALKSLGESGTNTIATLKNADNSTYTITGNSALTITNATAAVATGSVYDASALTGSLTIVGNATGFSAGSALGDVIKGGTAADNITASVNSGTLTGNGGTDAFNVSATVAGTTSGNAFALTTITDLAKAETVTLKSVAGTSAFTSTKVDVSAAATLGAAMDLAASTNVGAGDAAVKWFQYGSATYIVEDLSASTSLAATDLVVKLNGTVDLSTSTLSAAEVFTYA